MKSILISQRMKAFALLALFVTGAFSLSACNTMEGAGKDIQRAGEGVQDAAK